MRLGEGKRARAYFEMEARAIIPDGIVGMTNRMRRVSLFVEGDFNQAVPSSASLISGAKVPALVDTHEYLARS